MDPEETNAEGTEQVVDTQEPSGNPKWQPILDVLPEELHGLIKPQLAEWDKGINQKFQEIHSKYDPYKQYLENKVDPELIEQGLYLIQEFNNNPADIVKQAIEAFGLDFVEKAAIEAQQKAQQTQPDSYWDADDDDTTQVDITQHPQFKALADQVQKFTETAAQQQEREASEKAAKEFEQYLGKLEQDNGAFDKMYVSALISQGMDGEQAVKQYHDTVNQAAAKLAGNGQQQAAPPVVMGGYGTTGSGLPDQPVQFGSMKNNDLNDLVAQILAKQSET